MSGNICQSVFESAFAFSFNFSYPYLNMVYVRYRNYLLNIGLCPQFLAQNSGNPCHFLSNKSTGSLFCSNICFWSWFLTQLLLGYRSISYSNEATLGRLLDEGGLVIRKNKPWLEAWNFQSCPHSPEEEEELKMELMIDHASVRKPP